MFSLLPNFRVVAVLCVVGLVSSCGSTPRATDKMQSVEQTETEIARAGLLPEYLIGVGDMLEINVWKNAELSVNVTVLPDGNISMPLVGDIAVAGATTTSLAETVKEALTQYVRQPEVTVTVVSARSAEFLQRVRITGAVNAPLSLPYSRGMTVLDLVLQAGGLTDFANPNRGLLYRKGAEGMEIYPVRLQDILNKGQLETNYALRPNDIITVPEKSF